MIKLDKVINKQQLDTVGKYAKKGCKLLAYGLVTVLSYVSVSDLYDMVRYSGDISYSDAVGAIMNSNMYDSSKTKIISVLTKDADSEFYKTIIQVVKSDMYDSSKVSTILNMCEKN